MIPYWYQIGIPIFFLAVAGVGVVIFDVYGRRLDQQLRDEKEARAKAHPAE